MEFSRSRSTPQSGNTLAKELYRAYLDEFNAIMGYSQYAVALEPFSPTVAALFTELSLTEMRHFETLARILRDLGYPYTIDTRLKQMPIRITRDANAAATARRLLTQSLADEQNAARNYRRLAETAGDVAISGALRGIASDEESHAAAITAALAKLERS